MKYKIIKADNSETLENLVNEAIGEGWQPHGGISVIRYEISSLYESEAYEGWSQAMMKKEMKDIIRRLLLPTIPKK